ncbi:MAG TPA: NYN domain-containing protein [Candidatus Limnocylindrales bacterium]|nr:NYN domain-containing protein [Candidatus Limnocylindrales bacterium]
MGKNVAVFVDVANIFYAAKAAGVDIDYVTLLKSATAGRDFVRAYAYTGLDPDNENQRNFHAFLARNSYKVVSKDIRKYGDGKVKANLDIELVVDLMKTARNLDVAIVVSGDGDFAPAIRAVQEMGVRVEVISFRGNTSSDLIEVADLFTDITQLARVEKGSSRSGRRVAGDEEDLSMTEVPDKQTEGTGTARGRGRGGRGRGRAGEAEPVAARARTRVAAVAASENGAGAMTVLPGEKLSKAAAVAATDEPLGAEPLATGEPADTEAETEEGRRRRRRRGGRGRGRGRGREQEVASDVRSPDAAAELPEEEEEEDIDVAVPSGRRPTPFGSVWDSQLGVPSSVPAGVSGGGGLGEDEDFDEPEIPEYLIAEQRRGQAARGGRGGGPAGRGGRGGRGSYGAAIDRERYGRGGGGGINRYPDVSGRDRGGAPSRGQPAQAGFGRGERHDRAERPERSASRSNEPWSEVPEDLQAMLRAQLAQSPKAAAPKAAETRAPIADEAAEEAPAPKRRTTRTRTKAAEATTAPADAGASDADVATGPTAPKRRTTRRKAETEAAPGEAESPASLDATAPKRRTTRTTAATRTTRSKATSAATSDAGSGEDGPAEAPAPKRRTTRRKAATEETGATEPS